MYACDVSEIFYLVLLRLARLHVVQPCIALTWQRLVDARVDVVTVADFDLQ